MKNLHLLYMLVGIFLLIGMSTGNLYSQNKEFWFVVPDAAHSHDDYPIFFMFTAGDKETTVTMSMPASSSFQPKTKTLAPFESWKIVIAEHKDDGSEIEAEILAELAIYENSINDSYRVTKKGILITATEPITAYYELDGYKVGQKEIFSLKGEKALGTEFYTPFNTYYQLSTGYESQAFRQIQIVAADNNTIVNFNAPSAIANAEGTALAAGVNHSKTLQRGETLLLRENVVNSGLMGTHIWTNGGRIAVTVFEDCVSSNGSDPIGDQIVPVENVGTSYVVVKGFSTFANNTNGIENTADHVYILATEDNTTVRKDGGTPQVINKGAHIRYNIGNGETPPLHAYFETDKPAYCFHQSAVGGEVGGALIPSMYSIASKSITFDNQALITRNSIFLVYRESAQSSFRIKLEGQNEKELEVNSVATGVDDWLYARQDLEKVKGTTTISNAEGAFAMGYFASPGGTALYGYLSNFGSFTLGGDTLYICGDSYTFDGGYAKAYEWTDPDGNKSYASTLNATKSGPYTVTVDQDAEQITDNTYLKLQNFKHTIVSQPKNILLNEGGNVFTVKMNPEEDKDNYYNVRYDWDFGPGASVPTHTQTTRSHINAVSPAISWNTPGSKTVTLKVTNLDGGCDYTITFTPVSVAPRHVYWSRNAVSSNWNDFANWAIDVNSTPLNGIPAPHSVVHILGGAVNYPSLDTRVTYTYLYDSPRVDSILFHYGGELAYPHLLEYEKAFVQYNFGYYTDGYSDGEQPARNEDNSPVLKRDTWHALAVPLHSAVTGDFALAGHPFTWKAANTAKTEGNLIVIDNSSVRDYDQEIESMYNAIAVKVAPYRSGVTGFANHRDLQGLKGIIQLPFFLDDKDLYHPLHTYKHLRHESEFNFFDPATLKILPNSIKVKRGPEANRFLFEDKETRDVLYIFSPIAGVVPGYSIDVVPDAAKMVMVGNPFPASLSALRFAQVNNDLVDITQGYYLYDAENGVYRFNEYGQNSRIPSFQSYLVTLLSEAGGTLYFPLEGRYALTGDAEIPVRSAEVLSGLSVQVTDGSGQSGDAALLLTEEMPAVRKVISPENRIPEVFFVDNDQSLNLRQPFTKGVYEIPLGIRYPKNNMEMTLSFSGVEEFESANRCKLVLIDRKKGIQTDIASIPVYRFDLLSGSYTDTDRFMLRVVENTTGNCGSPVVDETITVNYKNGELNINATAGITAVKVYNPEGQQLYGNSQAHKEMNFRTSGLLLSPGIYLVMVQTETGRKYTKKLTVF